MPAVVDAEKCEGCADCIDVCPQQSMEMVDGKAIVKPDDCIDCNACMDACTKGAITIQ